MKRSKRNRAASPHDARGTPPGSVAVLDPDAPTQIHVLTYAAGGVKEYRLEITPGDRLPEFPPEPPGGVRWINITGVHDGVLLQDIGRRYGMHPLMVEDVQHTEQRPKFVEAEEGLFAVIRMITWPNETARLDNEQVGMFAVGATVLSFQERAGDVFEEIRDRIRTGRGRVRSAGADYLVYVLLDALIDGLFEAADALQMQVEDMEEHLLSEPKAVDVSRVHRLRGDTVALRRSLWPMREMLQRAARGDYDLFGEATLPFLSDGYDHVLTLIDLIDSQADRVSGLFQLHAAVIGSSTNEVMRVLTIIATIFIPLTFVAGIYGMNFAAMPELSWRYGYPVVLGLMVVIALGMVLYFKRRKWL